MVFTINAYKIPLESVYRLKKNNNWEPQEHFLTIDFENDMIFNTHEEAEKWLADNNSLIIDFEGNLKLIQSNPEDIIYHSNYAVSNEVYNSGNGFVGREFSDLYIKYIYLNLLDNWVLHLESGRSIYVTCYEDNINEENTIYKINKLLADMN